MSIQTSLRDDVDNLLRRVQQLERAPTATTVSQSTTNETTVNQDLVGAFWVAEERDGLYSNAVGPPTDSYFDASAVVPDASLRFGVPTTLGELIWPHCTVAYHQASEIKIVRVRLCLTNTGLDQTVNYNATLSHVGYAAGSATYLGMKVGSTTLDLDTGSANTYLGIVGAGAQGQGLVAGSFVLPGGGAKTTISVYVKAYGWSASNAILSALRFYDVEMSPMDGKVVQFDRDTALGLLAA